MVMLKVRRVALPRFSLLFFFCASSLLAQNDRAGVTGRVADSTGAIVSGASVKVTNTATGQAVDLTTNSDGAFTEPSVLQPGPYRVEVSRAGFKTASTDVVLQIGDVRAVNFTLQPGVTTETVTVTDAAPLLQTETSSRGEVITGRQITELPIRDRNFTNLALLTPGVTRATTATLVDETYFNQGDPNAGSVGISNPVGGTEASRFSRSGGSAISANGLRATNNNFTLDGVDNNEPIYGSIGVFPNPDAIQEFQVQTSLAKAEAGRGGAQINTTIKSGTNGLHGSAEYYGQNGGLNATASEINRQNAASRAAAAAVGTTPTIIPKTATHVNEFGFTLGGPIIKDRTFFFGDYLGQRNLIPVPFHTAVPTAGARVGDFSAFSAQLVDPITGLPFPGNVIPNLTSRPDFSKVTQNVFNFFPLPNLPNVKDPSRDTNPNFIGQRRNQEIIDSFDVKIDHRVSNKNNVNFRYTRDNQDRTRGNFFPKVPTAGFGAGEELGNTRQIAVSDTHTFQPTLLNEFRFGYTSVNLGINNCGVNGACGVSATWCKDVGIPNCNKGTEATTGGLLLGFGGGNVPGELEFLGDGGIFLEKSHSFYVADSVTLVRGKHSWKAGVEVRPRHIDQLNSGGTDLKGAIAYGGGGKTGVNQANALLSQPADFSNSGTISNNDQPFSLHTTEYSLFVQDDWKTTPNLALNLGVRWDVFPTYTEENGRIGNYDPVTNILARAGGSGNRLVTPRHNNFGPRAGFAYAFGPERRLALRGGYGIFYAFEGFGNDYPLQQNPPNTAQVFGPTAPGQVVNLQNGPPVATITDPPVIDTGTVLYSLSRNGFKDESIQEYNLGVEWQFTQSLVLDVGTAGTRSHHLLQERQLGGNGNGLGSAVIPTVTSTCAKPPCHYNDVRLFDPRANSFYDSLQVGLVDRFSHGVTATAAYTWSHGIDDSTGLFGGPGDQRGQVGGPVDPFNLGLDRASSTLDHRHVFNSSVLWDLPFGRGKQFGSGAGTLADRVIGGWQLNLLFNASSGQHFTVVGPSPAGTIVANIVGDPFAGNPKGTFVNFGAFSAAQPANAGTTCVTNLAGNRSCFGDSGRNRFTGPGYFRTDTSFLKNLRITERVNFQFGLEALNVFNRDDHVIPLADIGGSKSTFGQFRNALPPRALQYRGKIIF